MRWPISKRNGPSDRPLRNWNGAVIPPIPMIDREGHYVGTVTEGDILWTLKKRYNMNLKEAENIPVTSVERRIPFKPVSIDATMEDLVQMAMNQNFVPVIDDKKIFIGHRNQKGYHPFLLRGVCQKA